MTRGISWIAAILVAACGGSKDVTDSGLDAGPDASGTDTGTDTGTATGDPDCPNTSIEQEGAGLFWLKCLAGQCEEDGMCTGEPTVATWEEAQDACPAGTRLPTVEEVMSLLGECPQDMVETGEQGFCAACPASAACSEIYPGVADIAEPSYELVHWTSSEVDSANAWWVNFKTGLVSPRDKVAVSASMICVH